jgi:hypothetical protein
MRTVDSKLLERWGVSFYEAMEIAKQNLHQNTREYAKAGDLYAVVSGDSYDASRLVLKDYIQSMEVSGDKIAMVPNREALYVCGSDDAEALAMMAHLTKENFQHERNISRMAYRFDGDEWEVWLPPEHHPSYQAFQELFLRSFVTIFSNADRSKDSFFVSTSRTLKRVPRERLRAAGLTCSVWFGVDRSSSQSHD